MASFTNLAKPADVQGLLKVNHYQRQKSNQAAALEEVVANGQDDNTNAAARGGGGAGRGQDSQPRRFTRVNNAASRVNALMARASNQGTLWRDGSMNGEAGDPSPSSSREGGGGYSSDKAMDMGVLSQEEALVVELNKRVRELSSDLEDIEVEKQTQWKGYENKLEKKQVEVNKLQRKLDFEKLNLGAKEKEMRQLKSELRKYKNKMMRAQVRLVAMELQSKAGWQKVGDRNLQLQKIRQLELSRKAALERERAQKNKIKEDLDTMVRTLKPLQQKNMEMQYILQLREEELSKVKTDKVKLSTTVHEERRYAEKMGKQAQHFAQERSSVLEDAARKQLQLQELHDDVNDLLTHLHNEQDLRYTLEANLHSAESKLESAENLNSELEKELGQAMAKIAEYENMVENAADSTRQMQMELIEANQALELEQDARHGLEEERSMMQLHINELSLQSPLLHNVRYNAKSRKMLQDRIALKSSKAKDNKHS